MLELLTRYAQTHNLVTEPGFKPKNIRWVIVFDSKTGFCGLEELGQSELKKNPGRTFARCPDLSQPELISGPKARSHFLVETASVVAMFGADTEDARAREKYQNFIDNLAEAGKLHPQLADIATYLRDEEIVQKIQLSMTENKVKSGDKVTFRLNNEFPVEEAYWHDWWRNYRQTLKGKPDRKSDINQMRCFVTGKFEQALSTHDKIEGLSSVGGLPMGDVLIGFDKEAYRSYGLEQSANAAVSAEAMSAYRAGLNDLIKNHSQRLAGTKVVHWFKQKVANIEDPLEWLIEPPELNEINAQHKAKKLLESIKTGERSDLASNHYYSIDLTGASGRVMVRDWIEGEFKELMININQWFDDLEIINLSGEKNVKDPGLERIVTCLLPPRRKSQKYYDWIKPIGGERLGLLHAAVKGLPIMHNIIPRVVFEHRDFILAGELEQLLNRGSNDSSTGLMYSLLYTRMGLIKAYHLRKYRKEGNNTLAEMLKPVLNEDFPSAAYQCGRLMAVLAELQRSALGDVGAGVVQRYYAAASTTPALVLGRLTRTSQFHLNKLAPGLAYWYESKIAGIWSRLNEAPPKNLSLEEQSLFAMGYYQQLAEMRTKKSTNSNKEEK